jgi:hypothetical protein
MDSWTCFSKSGVNGDPTLAAAEKGRIIFEAVVRTLSAWPVSSKTVRAANALIINMSSAELVGSHANRGTRKNWRRTAQFSIH